MNRGVGGRTGNVTPAAYGLPDFTCQKFINTPAARTKTCRPPTPCSTCSISSARSANRPRVSPFPGADGPPRPLRLQLTRRHSQNPVRAWNKRSETKRSGVELRAVRTPKRKSRLKWRTHEVRFTGSWVFPSGRCHACGASLPIASPSTRACGKEGHYDSGEEVRATNGDRDSHNRCAAAL
jgi:hypothetical protein